MAWYWRRFVYSYYATLTAPGQYVWYKPWGAKLIKVQLWGAGGGGQGGVSGFGATYYYGGSIGGYGGSCVLRFLEAAKLSSTVIVTIGAGGAGGAPSALNGIHGAAGGNSTFGSYITAYGGAASDTSFNNGVGGPSLPGVAAHSPTVMGVVVDNVTGACGDHSGAAPGYSSRTLAYPGGSSLVGGAGGGNGAGMTDGRDNDKYGTAGAGGRVGANWTGGGGSPGVRGVNNGHAPAAPAWCGGGGGGAGGYAVWGGRGANGSWACGGGGGGCGYAVGSVGGGNYGGNGGPGYAIICVYW